MKLIGRWIVGLALGLWAASQAFGQTPVIGLTAPGATPAGAGTYPVLCGYLDGSGLVQALTGSGGALNVNASFSGTVSTGVAQGSTTSGQVGPLTQGAVTTASPSYTNGQTSPLSLTPSGELRIATIRLNGSTIDLGNGATGSGTQRVTIANDSTGQVAVAGTAAAGASASGNPVQVGGVYSSSLPAPSTGQMEPLPLDADGTQIVKPFTLTSKYFSGTTTSTDTSAHTIVNAQGVGVKFYCTTLSLANTGSTTTLATISGSGTLWYTIVPAGGGSNITFPVPIATAANTALQVTFASASTTCYASAAGYDGP